MLNNFLNKPLLEISLLGRFEVKINGVPVDERSWVRSSAKSLVKLLALKSSHTLHRERIIDLLWAEHSPKTAVNNLDKALYRARRALEPDLNKGSQSQFILSQKNQIILDSPGSLKIDLDEFEKLANYAIRNNDLEAGQKAIELYGGDLLDENIYEDWIYTRRESMRILFRKTATKTAEIYAAKGNHAESIEILKKLLAEDATDEHIHRLLMRSFAETGSKYQALKQFEQCRTALKILDVEPDAQTIALEKSIKLGEILPAKKLSESASAGSAVSTPHVTPLTFQNGIIKSARFSADGQKVLMSADWDGEGFQMYTISLETNEIQRLGIKEADVFSISSAGEMAVGLKPDLWDWTNNPATLAMLPPTGGLPHKLLEDIQYADWHPGGKAHTSLNKENSLAVVRENAGKNCLEYPIGNVIFKTGGWISHPRFSADGKKIAFIEHPIPVDDEGYVALIDLESKNNERQILTDKQITIQGLAWRKDEIWFTASRKGPRKSLNAVNLKGEERLIYRGIGNLRIHDVSRKGQILITDDKRKFRIMFRHAEDKFERDLTWHDHVYPRDITDDGKTILLEEASGGGRNHYSVYLRKVDDSSTRIIGSGVPLAFSPDEKSVILRIPTPHNHLAILTIDTGEIKTLAKDSENSLIYQAFADFFPDGERIIFAANKINRGTRIYIQDINGGTPVCFTPDEEGISMSSNGSISPDGKQVVLRNSEDRLMLYQITDGTSKPLKNLGTKFHFIRWSADGENLFLRNWGKLPCIIYKYNLANATKEKWLKLMPKDRTGVNQLLSIKLTPDGKSYTYPYQQESSDLYLMEDF